MKSKRFVPASDSLAKAAELAQILCRPSVQNERELMEKVLRRRTHRSICPVCSSDIKKRRQSNGA